LQDARAIVDALIDEGTTETRAALEWLSTHHHNEIHTVVIHTFIPHDHPHDHVHLSEVLMG
jgi:hypothetical protein